MLEFIQGRIVDFLPKAIIFNLNGLGLKVVVSENTIKELQSGQQKQEKEVKILTYLSIQENKWEIYGFLNEGEKNSFLVLLNCRGIGPKGAINILNTLSPSELYEVASGKVGYERLQQAPGVGAKSAQRIAIELKNQLGKMEESNFGIQGSKNPSSYTQADLFQVLQNLGYRTSEIQTAINKLSSDLPQNLSEAVTQILRAIGKR